jgi:sec-independent protein translocase protein TatC
MAKTAAADTSAPPDDGRMSLMEHLVELRTRLIRCAIAIAIGAVLGWIAYNPVLRFLREPLEDLAKSPNVSDQLLVLDPLEGFMLRIKMSTYIGFALAMPFLLWQLWRFVAPGLYQNEKRYASLFVFSATLLFVLGAGIAYLTLPQALAFLQGVGGDDLFYQYSPQKYLTLIVYMMLAFGVGFEFPILLVFLQLVGVLKPQQLRDFRRFGIVIIFVLAAVITPSADPISLFALSLPMVLFYEISIIIGRIIVGRRTAAEVGSTA